MERIEFIKDLAARHIYWERDSLIIALMYCLTPIEACKFLDLRFDQDFDIRRKLLRKIAKDIERDIQDCHYQLIERLIQAVEELPYNKKNSSGYCLSYLYDYLPEKLQRLVLEFLATSKYVAMRRRALRKLESHWDSTCESLVSAVWEKYRDQECASLIVRNFPLAYPQEHLPELAETLVDSRPQDLAKLFIRVGEVDSSKLDLLEDLDEITFTYVLAKLQRSLTEETALELSENNKDDKRIGLLVWSFGQMGLWSVLAGIAGRSEELGRERLAQFSSQ